MVLKELQKPWSGNQYFPFPSANLFWGLKRAISYLTGTILMKRLGTWLLVAVMAVGLLCTLSPKTALAVELRNAADDKLAEQATGLVDLNNASVRRFQKFPGMYPTLAGKIVVGGPYESVEDVLSLDLTQRQEELFNKYKDNFMVTDPELALNVGFDRINDGQYR